MVLGFLTKINGVQHRAALFKFTGTDLYIWDSLDNSGGFLSLLDLEMNKSHSVGIPNELHRSYHRSGRRHLRIDHSGTHVLTGVRKEGRLDEVNTWKAVRRTPVPLEQWFPWEMNAGPWNKISRTVTLEKSEFGDGVYLASYICCNRHLDQLLARKESHQNWLIPGKTHSVAIFGEPL